MNAFRRFLELHDRLPNLQFLPDDERDRMMTAQSDMMSNMMEHMQAGKDSMATCPMMKMKPMRGRKH